AFRGLDRVDLGRRDDVYWTLRQTLASCREELDAFDRAFLTWFEGAPGGPPVAAEPPQATSPAAPESGREAGSADGDGEEETAGWSPEEILRRTDLGRVGADELEDVRRLVERIALARPQRRTRRLRRHRS